jgi:hypothetical protein
MPSKLGFGNSRTPMAKKVSYGSAMHYKNPIKKNTDPVPAQGSMTYPNNDKITAVTEEDKIVQDKISKSNVDNTEIGEKKKLIVQQYMATGRISDEDNQFLIDNK